GIFQAVEDKIREIIPERERDRIADNIGLPARSYNLAYTDGSTIGVNDGVILVALKEGHAPTADYVRKLREVLPAAFPEVVFYFQAARHRHPDPQFRASGANQRAYRRLRSSNEPARCERTSAAHCRNSRSRRRPSPAGSRRTGVLRHDRPRASGSAGA